ncbi:MAG: hypothetical protein NC225_07245 [Clostridium sp.]|nr:hypothetical protein [Clostridium sp.]MCM1399258.1 hypothetical protein [Clostridium sp.]MCM1459746.1 hypothetical protein [Bacteroides sp.]
MTLEMHYREKYEEGVEDGRSEGIAQAISNTISILRRNNFSDDKIISELTTAFGISTEEAEKIVLNKA